MLCIKPLLLWYNSHFPFLAHLFKCLRRCQQHKPLFKRFCHNSFIRTFSESLGCISYIFVVNSSLSKLQVFHFVQFYILCPDYISKTPDPITKHFFNSEVNNVLKFRKQSLWKLGQRRILEFFNPSVFWSRFYGACESRILTGKHTLLLCGVTD